MSLGVEHLGGESHSLPAGILIAIRAPRRQYGLRGDGVEGLDRQGEVGLGLLSAGQMNLHGPGQIASVRIELAGEAVARHGAFLSVDGEKSSENAVHGGLRVDGVVAIAEPGKAISALAVVFDGGDRLP